MHTIIGKVGKKIAEGDEQREYGKFEIIDFESNSSYVDFRNELKQLIERFKIGQKVKIKAYVKGKLSRSGTPHNNIIATSIEEL